jgi:hypothetical protein
MSIDEVEPMMATRIMQDIRRQVAEGEARGEAKGMLEAIRQLARTGAITVDAARIQVKALVKAKRVPQASAKEVLAQLG